MAKKTKKTRPGEDNKIYGNPEYPAGEDIYSKDKKESFTEEEEPAEQHHRDKSPGDDLDIPGAELDDPEEEVGEEDEENNYYSLGGDNHNDLEEDRD